MQMPITIPGHAQNYTKAYHTYFSPRDQPTINLGGDEVYDRCERAGGEFADS